MKIEIEIPDEAADRLEELVEFQPTAKWSLKQQLALEAVDIITAQSNKLNQARQQQAQQMLQQQSPTATGGGDGPEE